MDIDWFPLWLSLRVAALATLFSLALGLWVAHLLARRGHADASDLGPSPGGVLILR